MEEGGGGGQRRKQTDTLRWQTEEDHLGEEGEGGENGQLVACIEQVQTDTVTLQSFNQLKVEDLR